MGGINYNVDTQYYALNMFYSVVSINDKRCFQQIKIEFLTQFMTPRRYVY